MEKINIVDFKNIEQAEIAFSPRVNCMVGANGSGKTNLLDAIYYLSLTKSASGLSDGQCVRHGREMFVVAADYALEQTREHVVCGYKAGAGKSIKRNGKEYERVSEHVGLLPVVISAPGDTSLISESADERRRFLNAFLSQAICGYLGDVLQYNNLLAQRNRALKDRGAYAELVEVIDLQMVDVATRIFECRREHLGALAPVAQELYAQIAGSAETIGVEYRSELHTMSMSDLLLRSAERDYFMGHTTVGVHRDDISLTINDLPIKRYGSQGQQKSLLLALKLAQAEVIREKMGKKPILLLDDVFDKLDAARVENLLRVVGDDRFGQIFITDTDRPRMERILSRLDMDTMLLEVVGGTFTRLSGNPESAKVVVEEPSIVAERVHAPKPEKTSEPAKVKGKKRK